MRSGEAALVVAVVGPMVMMILLVETEAWGPVASLPDAKERLRRLQASLRLVQAGAQDDGKTLHSPVEFPREGIRGSDLRLPLELASSINKLRDLRGAVVERITGGPRLLSSVNHSVISLALLAFGVLLFDVLGGIFLTRTHQARETLLPGLGLLGDAFNNLAEVALNALTIYLYREESPDCSERLLCESSLQAGQRGLLDGVANYLSGLLVSLFLPEKSLSRSLEAMRAGRRSGDCVDLYPRCSIHL